MSALCNKGIIDNGILQTEEGDRGSALSKLQSVGDACHAGEQLVEHGHEALAFLDAKLPVMAELELQVPAGALQR